MSRYLTQALVSVLIALGLMVLLALFLVRPDLSVDTLVDSYSNAQSQFIEIDGMAVHVRDQGSKDSPAILLLHGTFSSLHTWSGWVDELVKGHRVVSIDLPGFGLTGPHPQSDYSLQATLFLLESLRAELGIVHWVVAGNSLGAGYALAYAQHFPDSVLAVGLLNGGRIRLTEEEFEAQRERVVKEQQSEAGSSWVVQALRQPQLRQALGVITPKFLVRLALEDVYADPERIDDDLVERYQVLIRRQGNRQAFMDRFSGSGPVGRLEFPLPPPIGPTQISQPVLIQWGGQDRWISPTVGDALALALPTSTHIVYDDLGHVPMEEDPERTVADFMAFLSAAGLSTKTDASWVP